MTKAAAANMAVVIINPPHESSASYSADIATFVAFIVVIFCSCQYPHAGGYLLDYLGG